MLRRILYPCLGIASLCVVLTACSIPSLVSRDASKAVPAQYGNSQDTVNSGKVKWKAFFNDPYLKALIDTALQNNQELNILLQEIAISKNEVQEKKGEYLPFVNVRGAGEVEKVGRFTGRGAMEATTEIEPGREMPEPLPDFMLGAYATWEVDIWRKLRNSRDAAMMRYLSSVEGRNFMVTHLVAEIANSYYELLALDNQLAIVKRNIKIQSDVLNIVKMQKQAARVTELAVRKFEAQLFHTQSLQYEIQQQIVETENRINFLVGRFPQPIQRNADTFTDLVPNSIFAGLPSQLLENRPDIKQAELELAATKLDVKAAKANFYPSLDISAGVGLQAFNPVYLVNPESMLYALAGDLMAPLINRNAIKATYLSANAKQLQAVYHYEQTLLIAYLEVATQLAKIDNLEKSYSFKSQEVQALTQSINISNDLFQSARADYMEVLMTQRDALESKFDLVETKLMQMNAVVDVYQALGGGWQ